MERYRRTGGTVTVEALHLSDETYDDVRWLVPNAVPVQEQDPITRDIFRAYNIPTPSGMKRLSQGMYLVRYAGQFEVEMPTRFRQNYVPVEIPRGEVPKDVRDSKILRAHEDET